EELAAIALDLGAGDVLPDSLGGVEGIDAAAEMLRMQLSRKSRLEQHRAEVERHMLWAMTDPLTGLFNRRYALPRLTEIAREAMDKSVPFSVLALDLDRFKDVNDQHGHGAGDAVLSVVAQRMRQVLAARGMAARLGGEEFAVVLCPCAEDQAAVIAERLRLAIQDSPVALPELSGGGQCWVTVSVGVVTVRPRPGDWPDILAQQTLECADRALLAAKGQGRNRVVISGARHAA
ncbi:MAG: GGDEF domain-containing protein, partial [Paracoccus sp. (in: a-proteobacteria)]|nr:GGDEF domain-containing protein [Paracoccus sp. (in: a-proteobacteria)]